MRERLSWGQVNPEEGKLNWDKYQTVADVLAEQGVRAYQIFHDSPGWTHPGKQTRCVRGPCKTGRPAEHARFGDVTGGVERSGGRRA